ncbi:hypothetical protein GDO81_005300 [Engystomops pustulosus]|uniref:Uncharacterized protein n=1 Tax=Engystomops pustulosus TaxID=76066 RepID=A0AAV7CND3_ENGPU|nr:hypothetical protein GDO81_005300 [Engystomops pustulosus]
MYLAVFYPSITSEQTFKESSGTSIHLQLLLSDFVQWYVMGISISIACTRGNPKHMAPYENHMDTYRDPGDFVYIRTIMQQLLVGF